MSQENQELWARVLGEVAGRVRPELVGEWLADLEPLLCAPGRVVLAAASRLHARMVADHYAEAIAEAFARVTGSRPEVRLVARDDPDPADPAERPEDAGVYNPAFTLAGFVEGSPSRLALAACRAVAERPGELYNPLFLHGPSGTGKTHLLQGVCRELARTREVTWLTAEEFSSRLSAGGGEGEAFRQRLRQAQVLALDDVQMLRDREQSLEELFHVFNALYNRNGQLLFAADAPPRELPGIPERLKSRFTWGLAVEIEPPLFENRLEILASKAAVRGMQVPADVLERLAATKTANVRELEGLLAGLAARGLSPAASPEPPAPDRRPRPAVPADQPAGPSTEQIQQAVAAAYGLKAGELLGGSRSRSVAMARHLAVYLTKQLTPLTTQEIGGHFGGRDHSTVAYAIRKIESLLGDDPPLASLAARLTQQLTGVKHVE